MLSVLVILNNIYRNGRNWSLIAVFVRDGDFLGCEGTQDFIADFEGTKNSGVVWFFEGNTLIAPAVNSGGDVFEFRHSSEVGVTDLVGILSFFNGNRKHGRG